MEIKQVKTTSCRSSETENKIGGISIEIPRLTALVPNFTRVAPLDERESAIDILCMNA